MANKKVLKATLKRGASYTLPGVGVFQKGISVEVTEEQAEKLRNIGFFDIREAVINPKSAQAEEGEENVREEGEAEAGEVGEISPATAGEESPAPKKKKKKK